MTGNPGTAEQPHPSANPERDAKLAPAQAAYDLWKRRPGERHRGQLRAAILACGGVIEGHGVIGWAKANLR